MSTSYLRTKSVLQTVRIIPEQTQRRRMMQQGKDGRVAGDSSDRGSLGPYEGRNVYTESYVQGRIQKRKQRVASARSSRCNLASQDGCSLTESALWSPYTRKGSFQV